MKNLIFSVVLLLTVTFTFAENAELETVLTFDVEETLNSKDEISENVQTLNLSTDSNIAEQISTILVEGDWICAELYVNGVFVGYVCGETIGEIIDKVIDMFF